MLHIPNITVIFDLSDLQPREEKCGTYRYEKFEEPIFRGMLNCNLDEFSEKASVFEF